MAQALLLQPAHSTPAISQSHLILVLQGPTVEENPEGVVGLDGHRLFCDAHNFIIVSAQLQMPLGTDDQSIERCEGKRELELPITFPFPQWKTYTPFGTVLLSSTIKGPLGSFAEKDQPIDYLPNYLSFLTTHSPLSRPEKVKENSIPTKLGPCPKPDQERSDGDGHLLTRGLLPATACPFPSLLGSTFRGIQSFRGFHASLSISNKAFPRPAYPHHDIGPTCHSPLEPSSGRAGHIPR